MSGSRHSASWACATGCVSGIGRVGGSAQPRSPATSRIWSSTGSRRPGLRGNLALRAENQLAERLAERPNQRRRVALAQFEQHLFNKTARRRALGEPIQKAIQIWRQEDRDPPDQREAHQALDHVSEEYYLRGAVRAC